MKNDEQTKRRIAGRSSRSSRRSPQFRLIPVVFIFIAASAIPPIIRAAVWVNQEGYLPEARKLAWTDTEAESLTVRDTESGMIVWRDTWEKFSDNDPATGMKLFYADFSQLSIPGNYRVEIPEGARSYRFMISDTVYQKTYRRSLKGLYYQRCGTALDALHAGPYVHNNCHSTDGIFHPECTENGYRTATGGWHDAGDYGKYSVPAAVTIGTLLFGYEWYPERLADDRIGIPESGNGIPDILDEAAWGLEWLMSMQRDDGAVNAKLTPKNFAGFIMPDKDYASRYIYPVSSAATADLAAVAAQAARIYRPFNANLADSCLAAAQRAWSFLQQHPDIVPAGGFRNPDDTHTGEYGDGDDRDERLWAAVELYITTGEDGYHQYIRDHYSDRGLFTATLGWRRADALALMQYIHTNKVAVDTEIRSEMLSALYNYCDGRVTKETSNGFHVILSPGDYNWGSNSVPMNASLPLLLAFELSGEDKYRRAALSQLHYILGANAHGFCFVTGCGDFAVINPHHRPSDADGVVLPVPGLLAGGPNEFLQDDILSSRFNDQTPPALCYVDHTGSYAGNEITTYWNAPLILVAGYFNSENPSTGLRPPEESGSSKISDQISVFPNPFNDRVKIRLHLNRNRDVSITIYNSLGQVIEHRELGFLLQGEHSFDWTFGGASGVYLATVNIGQDVLLKKLVYVK